jgi:hypothetical protein
VRPDPLGGDRIGLREQLVQRAGAAALGHPLEALSHGDVGAREPEVEEHARDVEPGSAHQEGHGTAREDAVDHGTSTGLVPLDAGLGRHLELVEEVVRHSSPLALGHLGRADVHPPIELHRVGVDDLDRTPRIAETLGQVERERRLAGAGRSHDGDQAVAGCFTDRRHGAPV